MHTQLLIRGCCAVNKNDYFQLDRIAEVIASHRKTMENKNLFRGKVGGRRGMLAVSEPRCRKSCMCNRHDKRVLGGAMMVGSSDSETISPDRLSCSYFYLRAPWGFLCRGLSARRTPLSHGLFGLGLLWSLCNPNGWEGGAWGIALCNKVHVASAWNPCRLVNVSSSTPFSRRGTFQNFRTV